jgi:hypothetical protein
MEGNKKIEHLGIKIELIGQIGERIIVWAVTLGPVD